MHFYDLLPTLASAGILTSMLLSIMWLGHQIGQPGTIGNRFRRVAVRLKRIKIWHVMAAVAIIAVLMATMEAPGFGLTLVGFGLLVVCARAWIKEFTFLMALRDADFPGRSDKLIWVFLMIALAPVGYWSFRAFHESHWPEPAGEAAADQAVNAVAPELI